MKANHNQIVFAREYRSYSQTELASKIKGLSQSKLSKIEKGIEDISEELLDKISEELNFPKAFFELDIHNKAYYANYRKKRVNQAKKNFLDMRLKTYGYLVDSMNRSYIDYPLNGFPQIDLMLGFTPTEAAIQTRRLFNLKNSPVKDFYALLEDNGIVVIEDGGDIEEFDGVSFVSDYGNWIIVVNKKMPNDRKRFTLAHELGHLIMHNIEVGNYLIDNTRDLEKEANEFASEFLMPSDVIRNQLQDLKLSDLANLKQLWLTSMASIIYRASNLGCITKNWATYLNIELSRRGYKKEEPINVYIDNPKLFNDSYHLIKDQLNFTLDDMSKFFSFSKSDLEDLFSLNNKGLRLKVNFNN